MHLIFEHSDLHNYLQFVQMEPIDLTLVVI